MVTREEVGRFLEIFHSKLEIFQIIFRDDRKKNIQALAELEITAKHRENVLKEIVVEDYSEGPIIDALNHNGEMWVFGRDVKNNEVYIKISKGRENSQVICISFHIAEYKMKYPLRGGK